jgi:CHASE2 domain-containing sensor protein
MTRRDRPGSTTTQFAVVLIIAGLIAEMSPGLSRDFPGGGWSLLTAGAAALAAGILGKRSPKAARIALLVGFCLAGFVLIRGFIHAPHR